MLKDGMLYSRSLGRQINWMFGAGILSTILFFVSAAMPMNPICMAFFSGIFLFTAAFSFAVALMLMKKWIDKTYK